MAHASTPIRVGFVQDGARRRYIVPRALQQSGCLGAMYTDWFISPGSWRDQLTRMLPGSIRRKARGAMERRCDAIPAEKVIQSLPLTVRLSRARKKFPSPEAFFAWEAEQKGLWIQKHGLQQIDLWMGFVRNIPPNLCEKAREIGIPVIADQIIAPAAVEQALLEREQARWPGWDTSSASDQSTTIALEERTWRSLTRVTCMSPFVKDGLVQLGMDASRIDVIPYPFDTTGWVVPDRSRASGPVTIGFTGSINLRKGIPYFLEVAKRLQNRNVRFVMVGKPSLSDSALNELRKVADLTGPLPRAEVKNRLEQFDIFYFPSTCEGSAGSVAEAMASGLPVVTTYESGSVIRDGVDGFIVKYDDVDAATARLEQLVASAKLRKSVGDSARRRLEEFDLNWYAQTLRDLVVSTLKR